MNKQRCPNSHELDVPPLGCPHRSELSFNIYIFLIYALIRYIKIYVDIIMLAQKRKEENNNNKVTSMGIERIPQHDSCFISFIY